VKNSHLDLTSMKFSLVSGNGGTLIAAYYVNTAEEAVAVANALETLGMRPNVVKNKKYMVYVGLRDIKKNEQLREAAMRFLKEKMKSGTPREREIVRRIIKDKRTLGARVETRKTAYAGGGA
jgi:arginase family enzyme